MSGGTVEQTWPEGLIPCYQATRRQSERICQPLTIEDHVVQGMIEASPPKWHLAHTSWFFDTFVLRPYLKGYRPFVDGYEVLFNSYYETVGAPFPRPRRGLLSRPGVEEIRAYRHYIDEQMLSLLRDNDHPAAETIHFLTLTGIHHEQQHQELLYTDIKYNFSLNPLYPTYRQDLAPPLPGQTDPLTWSSFAEGRVRIGCEPAAGDFCYDNETPAHDYYLQGFALADRTVSNDEYREFIEDGGYRRVELWLSDGWRWVREQGWQAPLYWVQGDGDWMQYTLGGLRTLRGQDPVCHVSFYEADAYARWAGARLPLEQEWEAAASDQAPDGHFADADRLCPTVAASAPLAQIYGDVWEWTGSAYRPWPGFRPHQGPLGEYNGKFMSNQMVLRGGSCLTPVGHIRSSYRNFFYPHERWQMSGIRLANSL